MEGKTLEVEEEKDEVTFQEIRFGKKLPRDG